MHARTLSLTTDPGPDASSRVLDRATVGLQPGFGLLVGIGNFVRSQLRGEVLKLRLGVLAALGQRQVVPEICFVVILPHSAARPILRTERGERWNVFLLGGALEPFDSLRVALANAVSIARMRSA